jgi:hypothetical protein
MRKLAPLTALALVVAARLAAQEAAAPAPQVQIVAAELLRVDASRRALVLRPEGKDARELALTVTEETRLMARGRRVRLEDLRPGERVLASYADDGERRLARLVKIGTRPAALLAPPGPPK